MAKTTSSLQIRLSRQLPRQSIDLANDFIDAHRFQIRLEYRSVTCIRQLDCIMSMSFRQDILNVSSMVLA